MSLPLSAWAFFGGDSDRWIIPAQVIVTAAVGAVLAIPLRAMAPAGASVGMRVLAGAGWGVLAAVIGLVVFRLLLSGLSP